MTFAGFLTEQSPALAPAIPMILAAACALVRSGIVAWALASLAALGTLVATLEMAALSATGQVIDYHFGGWAPPLGIAFRVDQANALVAVVVAFAGLVTLVYARLSVANEIEARHRPRFYALALLCLSGLIGITLTGDAFNMFVFLEIASLSTYAMVATGSQRDRRALSAAFNYLVQGSLGATFFVIGVGLIYMATGTLNMADLATRLDALGASRTVLAGFAFVTLGLGLKAAIFPLHSWLPAAYAFAPSVATALLAASATKAAIYALIRFLVTIFGVDLSFAEVGFQYFLMPLALAGIFAGALAACYQRDLKRLLAWSSVSQVGYMVLGVALATPAGVSATLVHVFNHSVAKGGMFLASGCLMYGVGATSLKAIAGMGRRMPWTIAALLTGGLSLIGVPFTAGFVSKWRLLVAAIEADQPLIVAAIALSSILAVIYVWRIVEAVWFNDPAPGAGSVTESPFALLMPAWVLIGATIWFGVDASFTLGLADGAARTLLAIGPTGAGGAR